MTLTAQGKVTLHTTTYPLDAVNDAIADLDGRRLQGAAGSSSRPVLPREEVDVSSALFVRPCLDVPPSELTERV